MADAPLRMRTSLCRNRACVRPDHLEPVTHLENMRRGARASQTHCQQGHPYDDENTYHHATGRVCRACKREHRRKYRAKQKEQS